MSKVMSVDVTINTDKNEYYHEVKECHSLDDLMQRIVTGPYPEATSVVLVVAFVPNK